MAAPSVCAHCGFRNTSMTHFCARCEQPLAEPAQARGPQQAVDAGSDRTEVSYAPQRREAATPATPPPAAQAPPRQDSVRSPWPTAENSFIRRPLASTGPATASFTPNHPPHPLPAVNEAPRPQRATPGAERTEISYAPKRQPAPAPLPPPVRQTATEALAPPRRQQTPPAQAATAMLDADAIAGAWQQEQGGPPQGAAEPTLAARPVARAPKPARPAAPALRPSQAATQVGDPSLLDGWVPEAAQVADVAAPRGRAGQVPAVQAPAVAEVATPAATLAAPLTRVALAVAIDVAIVAAAMATYAALEMAALHGGWPSERATGLEAVAWWMYVYHRSVRRTLMLGLVVAGLHTALGVRYGRTAGRLLAGLSLVPQAQAPQESPALPWTTAAWHLVGGALCLMSLGAGIYWMLVDARGRTWANLLSRTVVVRRA